MRLKGITDEGFRRLAQGVSMADQVAKRPDQIGYFMAVNGYPEYTLRKFRNKWFVEPSALYQEETAQLGHPETWTTKILDIESPAYAESGLPALTLGQLLESFERLVDAQEDVEWAPVSIDG